MHAKRRIRKASITHISLVDKGANAKTIIWKNGENPVHSTVIDIRKTDDDERLVYGVVYSPDQVDNHGDVADAQVIKNMAYEFMKSRYTTNVDKQHDFVTGEGFVAESWLVRKGDAFFKDEPEGSWAVGIKVENDDTWQAVKKGDITGISMAGMAEIEEIQKADEPDLADKIISALKKFFGDKEIPDKKQEDTMTPEDISKQVTDAVTKALEPVNDRLQKLEKAEDKPEEQPVDMSDTITAAVTKALEPVNARLDALETASPGSKLQKGQAEAKECSGLELA